jgi:site-specific DNA-methyltransferase (cytosine-N4-specific)
MQTNQIYNEHCLETLRRMPDEFLDCVVTSPPYYGLRSYDAPESVWGNHNGCEHQFGQAIRVGQTSAPTKYQSAKDGFTQKESSFCVSCNAWRGQLGLEPTFHLYLDHLLEIFAEVKRVLKRTGSVWVNLGDTYANDGKWGGETGGKHAGGLHGKTSVGREKKFTGLRPKSLMNIPARFAIRMTDDLGFIQRNEINWWKPACMPSSATDRFTVDFEKIFFFTKSEKYYFEQQFESYTKPLDRWGGIELKANGFSSWDNGTGQSAYRDRNMRPNENGRNMRTTWRVNYEPSSENHFASYPTKLIETPIKAGCPESGIVYDPFTGTGTTLEVAHKLGRNWIGSEISSEYVEIANRRLEPILMQ